MIYTLTTLTRKDKRTWGYYTTEGEALKAVGNNVGNMMDVIYDYLVIEECSPGVIPTVSKESWFVWSDKRGYWVAIDKPSWTTGTINWAMG